MRPPHPLRVQLKRQKPTAFRDGADLYEVHAVYGPWNSSGCWWSIKQWNMEEWDVKAINNRGETISCLIVHDNLYDKWILEAFYD
jgi:hypothetical protein